jgi:Fe-S cluster biosynthesis and repair protein YggX
MSRTIHCVKLNKEGEALDTQTYPGTLGEKILASISKEAWKMWLAHQTLLINEKRLNLMDKDARAFLEGEMQKFLFGEGSAKPEGFVEPPKNNAANHDSDLVDETSDESFPASDPPSWNMRNDENKPDHSK